MTASLVEIYLDRLAQFEGRRYCSVAEACRYLDLSRPTVDALLNSRKIKSQYISHGGRKVLIASLLEYVEQLPIDRPDPKVRS